MDVHQLRGKKGVHACCGRDMSITTSFPRLFSENRTVRDVLRGNAKVPCEALVAEVVNMTLPNLLPGALRADLPDYL